MHHSLFGSDDEFCGEDYYASQYQLVLPRTSVMTMAKAVVILKAVVPKHVPH